MLLSAILSITILLPGLLVVINKRGGYREWLFLALSIFLSVWVFSNYLVDHDTSRALFWTRTTFFAIVLASFCFLEFAQHFPDKHTLPSTLRWSVVTLTIIIAILTYASVFIPDVLLVDGVISPQQGPLYPLFLLYYPLILLLAFFLLVRGFMRSKGVTRARVRTVLLALVCMTLITSTTNLILPELFSYSGLVPYGGFATIIFTAGVAYAMLKHHLFDIRAAVARATAYILSLVSIGIVYSVVAFGLLSSTSTTLSFGQQFFYVAFALITATLYQPTKRFFDYLTAKIFYRDGYSTEEFLDELGDNLVTGYQLKDLTVRISKTTNKYLKSASTDLLLEQAGVPSKGVRGLILEQASGDGYEFPLVTATVADGVIRSRLARVGIAVALRLETKSGSIGYMVLSEKRSGTHYTTQDVQTLSIAADEIALALENALRFEQIEDLNANLQQKVDAATKELRHSNEKLKALDEAKDEFISMASHQLRTPLTSIKGYISMVLEGDAGKVSPIQKEMLQTAYTSSQRMVYLISDLLNVSRIQTGKFVIEAVDCYLPDVISEEIDQIKEALAAKNIAINYRKPAEFPITKLDETKIRQVIMNFADNALYYTPAGGEVTIHLVDKPKSIEFTVSDNGIGVPKAEQHKLFAKFYRAGNARKARPDGTGLGLFMAKKVIVASGGSIIFKSSEGKGSTFGFTFPKSKTT